MMYGPEIFDYLDGLREAGVVNMLGAAPYLLSIYPCSKSRARELVGGWMRTFSATLPYEERWDDFVNQEKRELNSTLLIDSKETNMAKLVIAPKPAPVVAKKEKKVKVEQPAPAAHGTDCFEGTIGGTKYLFDAGNGEALMELAPGTAVADQAASIKRQLIPRSKASKYAVNLLFRQWRQAKTAANTPA